MISIKNLWVKYPGSREYVLKGIDLEIKRGLVLIAGRTGSGKTTLARTIAGIIPHLFRAEVRGYIRVMDVDPVSDGIGALAGKLAYVSQNPEMFITSLHVMDELTFTACNIGIVPEKIIENMERVVKEFKLEEILGKSTLALSSGQLQLISIAAAIISGSKILILDEPMARLDPNNMAIISSFLRKVADDGHLVVVFEHHLDYILEIADRVIIMDYGKIIGQGRPDEVIDSLVGIDIPEICELFLKLYNSGCVDRIPVSIDDAIEVLRNARDRKRMV